MIHRWIKKIPIFKTIRHVDGLRCDSFVEEQRREMSNSSGANETSDGRSGKWPTGSKIGGYAFHPEIEEIFNRQVNEEFKAFYCYLSMASFFGRVDVAMPGCESYFTQMHIEEHEHALRCVNYVKMRGGTIDLCAIPSPDLQDWKCPLNAFKMALRLEMDVTDKLVNVNNMATKHGDLDASDFVITHFLRDQMKSVNEIEKFVNVLTEIGDKSLARFLFDRDLLDNHVAPEFNVLRDKGPPCLKTK